MLQKLKSRKLWMAVLSVLALALMVATHQMPLQTALDAGKQIVLVYLVAQGAADALSKTSPQ